MILTALKDELIHIFDGDCVEEKLIDIVYVGCISIGILDQDVGSKEYEDQTGENVVEG